MSYSSTVTAEIPVNLIFLDIDGVLIGLGQVYSGVHSSHEFTPRAVDVMNQVMDRADAYIVISSCWQVGRTVQDLQDLFTDMGFKYSDRIIDKTGRQYGPRGEAAQYWLDRNSVVTEHICIIDDEGCGIAPFEDRHVQPEFMVGLLPKHLDEILQILGVSDKDSV